MGLYGSIYVYVRTAFLKFANVAFPLVKETGWMELCKLWIVEDKYQVRLLISTA
jgi:hypothetical protein